MNKHEATIRGHPGYLTLARVVNDGQTVRIPDDGKEHSCVCGSSGYSVFDCDGWRAPTVVDDEGRWVSYCRSCDRELEVGTP